MRSDPTLPIAKALREARLRKGLSQRALGERAGVPQGHISRIEAGAVDLRLSSLIELARTLDLELALVPRAAVPAVQSIARGITADAAALRQQPRRAHTLDDEAAGDDA
ncbi:MAG: helix-turn-helix domain-containing protein [Reyranellaceae bacterium]